MKTPYLKTEWTDKETGARGYLIIDELKSGFCAGGIRMKENLESDEVAQLAEIMTVKMAGLGMNIGGAKGGINFPSDHPKSIEVLRRYLKAHLPFIKNNWLTSEDLGTKEEDINMILQEFGITSSVEAFVLQQENRDELIENLKKSMTITYRGMKMTDIATGYGVSVVTMETLKTIQQKESKPTAAIQGFGSVGASAAMFLHENEVIIKAIADIQGTIYAEEGLDIPLLLKSTNKNGIINRNKMLDNYKMYPGEDWLKANVDVLIPAAIPNAINEDNISLINTSLVVEGGNLPVSSQAEKLLFEKGVLVVPDFIANSGGAGLFVSVLNGHASSSADEILKFLDGQLSRTIKKLITISSEQNIRPREAAYHLVYNN